MSRELAKTLAVLQQLVENVDAVIPLDRISAAEIRRHPAASQLDTWLTGIWRWDNELRPLLDDILLAQRIPMTEVPAKLSAFFHETYLPNRDRLLEVWFAFAFDAEAQLAGSPPIGSIEAETSIKETLDVALEVYARKLEDGNFDNGVPEQVTEARKLLGSDKFHPDLWLARFRAVEPLLTSRAPTRIPTRIRDRLGEAYWSFAFGNWFAALSVSRALLEYALHDRARYLGFEPDEIVDGRKQSKPLWKLIEGAERSRPALAAYLQVIRDEGNEALHPRRDDEAVRLPHVLERRVLRVLHAIRVLLLELYP